NKTLEFEPDYVKNNQICEMSLGKIRYFFDNKKYILKNHQTVTIHYDSKLNKYTLLVPEKVTAKTKERNVSDNFISIDQGLRKFITGLTKDGVIEIGTKLMDKIKKLLKRIDKIEKDKKNLFKNKEKKKKIKLKKYRRKISNIMNETHWKSINYITKNF